MPSRPPVASTGWPATCTQQPQRTGPAWPVSGWPDGTNRRRLIPAERSLSSVCLVKVRSEGVGQLHEPQDPASTATLGDRIPSKAVFGLLRDVYPDEATRYRFGRGPSDSYTKFQLNDETSVARFTRTSHVR